MAAVGRELSSPGVDPKRKKPVPETGRTMPAYSFGPSDAEMRRPNHVLILPAIFFPLALASCAVPTFTNYRGLTLSDQQVATLGHGWGCAFCIEQISATDVQLLFDIKRDGSRDSFKLTPGDYLIRIAYQGPKIPRVFYESTVKLKASHVYRVKSETCFAFDVLAGGACHGRHAYTGTVWIEDTATGEVVVGEKWG
jgi:hypothetical protein